MIWTCRPSAIHPCRKNARCLLVLLALAHAAAGCADEGDQEEPSATPYRPTVSNPAALSAPGWIEVEFGGQRLFADRSRLDSVPWLLKYAFDENYGLLLGGDAHANLKIAGAPSISGFGDTFLEWKQRFPVSDKSAFGIEAGVVAATAQRDLGIGSTQYVVNGIFSAGIGELQLDLNLGGLRGGNLPSGVSLWQTTWAATVSGSFTENWGAAFEFSGAHQRGIATQSEALAAISYNYSRRLVLDCGAAYGLAHAAHDRSVFAGATVLIGKLR